MENFLKIWSIVILSLWSILLSAMLLFVNDKNTRKTAFIIVLLFAPVFYYIIKF